MNHTRTHLFQPSAFKVSGFSLRALAGALVAVPLATLLHAQSVVNVSTDADLGTYAITDSTVLTFADSTSGSFAITNVGVNLPVADVLANGNSSFKLTGGGFLSSSGTLFLGWNTTNPALADLVQTPFTGVLDFTGLTANTFAGIELDSGALRINSAAQLGTTLSNLNFGGVSGVSTGTLVIAGHSNITFDGQGDLRNRLTIGAGDSGVFYLESSSTLTFQDNKTATPSTILFAGSGNLVFAAADDARYVFQGNVGAAGAGGLIAATADRVFLDITNALFDGNSGGNNGAININPGSIGGSVFRLTNSEVTNNISTGNGAFVYVANSSTFTINSVVFGTNSTTGGFGGVMMIVTNAVAVINDSEFRDNHGGSSGGGVIGSNAPGSAIANNTEFERNYTPAAGGVLYHSSTFSFTGSNDIFDSNKAATYGGAIGNSGSAIYNLTNAIFTSNTAGTYGGAIGIGAAANITLAVGAGSTSLIANNQDAQGYNFLAVNYTTALVTSATLNVETDGTLDMLDPIRVNASTVAGATFLLTKTGAGVWKLAGSSTIAKFGAGNGGINVTAGELYLYGVNEAHYTNSGAGIDYTPDAGSIHYDSLNNAGGVTFTLAKSATLGIGGGNVIDYNGTASNNAAITLAAGSILDFNLANAVANGATGDASENAMLMINTNGIVNQGNTKIVTSGTLNPFISLDFNTIASGTYNLFTLNAVSGAGLDTITDFGSILNNASFAGQSYDDFNANGYIALFGVNVGTDTLWVSILNTFNPLPPHEGNSVLTWTGSTNRWLNIANWLETAAPTNPALVFNQGDIVNFDSTNTDNNTVLIAGSATVSGIYFSGASSYAMTGSGNIVANATSGTYDPATNLAATGKLILGAIATNENTAPDTTAAFTGVLDLTGLSSAPNNFAGGVEINSGALRISTIDQLGTTLSNLHFTGATGVSTGTLVIASGANLVFDSTGDSTFPNRINILPNTSAAFYLENSATMTIQGNNTGAAGSAISLGGAGSNLVLAAAGGARYVLTDNIGGGGGGIIAVLAGCADITNASIEGVPGVNIANNAGINVSSGTLKLANSTITNVQAGGNGGAIYIGAASPALPLLEINNVVFNGNSAGNRGGGIFLATNATVTINSSTFSNNNAAGTGDGGGAIANAYAVTTFFLNNVTFNDNYTNKAGGAVLNEGGTLPMSGTNLTFLNNTADTYGGAIAINFNSTINLTKATFTSNTAGTIGGAIGFNTAGTINLTNVIFTSNTAGTDGGAIAIGSNNSNVSLDNFSFLDNIAGGKGGAISFNNAQSSTLTLTVDSGTSVFAGNTSNGAPNSIYLANATTTANTVQLNVDVADRAQLDMLDPMEFNNALSGDQGTIKVVKTGAGVWKLSGTSSSSKTAANGQMSIAVNEGTLYLYGQGETSTNGTVFGPGKFDLQGTNPAGGNSTVFTVNNGATLGIGGGNSISIYSGATATGTITFVQGSILSLNLDADTYAAIGGSQTKGDGATLLTLTAASLNLFTSGSFNFSLDLFNTGTGTFNLLAANNSTTTSNYFDNLGIGSATNLLFWDNNITGIDDSLYTYKTGITNNTLWITISELGSLQNSVLTWAGASDSWIDDNNWNALATTTPTGTAFTQGDIINLADSSVNAAIPDPAGTAITVDTTTSATIGGMYVSGTASYTITGTSIEAATGAGTLGDQPAATGKLIVGAIAPDDAGDILPSGFSGTLTLNNASNNFADGIVINSGELIGNAQTLGAGSVGITDNGVLTFNQVDTGAYDAPIIGTGVLNKTGGASLTLTAAGNSAFNGVTNINAGALLLGAALGGDVNVNATGLLGNSANAASVSGNVTVAGGGALMAGETNAIAPQTFAITGALTLDPGATLFYNILTGGLNDTITAASLTLGATGTININDAITGTYTLVDATAAFDAATLANASTLDITKNGGAITGRVAAHSYADADKLFLEVDVANISGTWTGLAGNTWNTTIASWTNPTDTVFYNYDAVTFGNTTSGAIAVNTVGVTVAGMTVDTSGGDYTFTDGPITTSTNATTLTAAVVGDAFGKLVKQGAGTLTLANTGTNTFEEGIDLEAGALVGNAATLNTGANGITTVASTTLTFDQAAATTYAANITGGADFIKAGAGNLTLTGLTNYDGQTTVSSGTLTLGNASQIATSAAITIDAGATLDAGSTATQTLNNLSGAAAAGISGNSTLFILHSTLDTSFAGVIAGSGSVQKTGAGTLTLAGDNTCTGETNIVEGAVQLGAGSVAGSVTGDIVDNAALILNHGAASVTFANAITGNGLITKTAADTGILTLTGNSAAFTGTTNILAGGLALSNNASLGGALNLFANTSLAGSGTLHNVTTRGSSTITIGALNNPVTAAPETLALTGTLTLAGPTTLLYDVYSASTSDLITAAALVRTGTDIFSINLGSFTSGTYTLISTDAPLAASTTDNLSLLSNDNALSGRTAAEFTIDSGTNLNLAIITHNVAGLHWDGTNTGLWQHNQTNWQTNDVFLNGDSVIFDNTLSGTNAVTIDTAGVSARAMTVNSATYTFTGGAITTSATTDSSLAAGDGDGKLTLTGNASVTLSNTAANLFEGGIDIAPTAALTGNAATLRVGDTAAIVNNGSLTFDQAATATYAAAITGAGILTKTGTGALTLNNAAHAAGLSVQQGSLTLAAPGATTQGDIAIASGASLLITASAAFSVSNPVTGAGLLSINTSGADFSFSPSALQPSALFSGTVALGASAFTLDATNAAALANATLSLGAGNTTNVAPDDSALQPFSLSALFINGGKLVFSTTIPADTQAAGIIQTDTLSLGASGTIQVTIPSGSAGVASTGATLFAQATGTTIDKLITANAVTGAANIGNLVLVNQNGVATGTTSRTANITQNGANVATGTYNYTLNATGGLNVNYALTALTIATGSTLQLAPVAGESGVFSATISGNGNLSIDATNAPVTLAAANNFSGATTVTSGTLIAGANNALGGAGNSLVLSSGSGGVDSAFNLNGKTQTLATLNTDAAATVNLASGTLAIANGGVVNGALAGAGALNLNGGSLTLNNANTALTASTTIAASATATLGDLAALGAGAIVNRGVLNVANTAAGALANAISGAGALNLNGSGITTLSTANTLTGPVAVNGPVVAANPAALGTGNITVGNTNPAVTLTYTVSGTIASSIAGAGILNLSGTDGDTTLTGNNTIASINALAGSSIVAAGAGSLGSASTNLNLTNATVTLVAPGSALGKVTMNGASRLAFANLAVGAATVTNLTAPEGSTPTLAFNTNVGAGASNTLNITGATSGTFVIDILNTGNAPAAARTSVSLIKNPGAASYTTGAKNGFDFAGAMTAYETDYDPLTGNLNVTRGDALSPTGGAIVANATSVMPLAWFAELDTLAKRLGDLHITTRDKPGTDLWMRGYAQRIDVNDKHNPVPFNETQYGIEAGLDYGGQLVGHAASFYAGVFLGYGTSDRDVADTRVSDGSTISNYGGIYVSLIAPGGSYVDFVCKFDNFKNSFSALSDDGPMNAAYCTNALGASLEAGKRIQYSSGWYVIPSAQVALTRINSADYTTIVTAKPDSNLLISQDQTNSNQLKAGVMAGYMHPLPDGQAIQPYAKLYYARQWTGGGAINVRSANFVADDHGPYYSTIEGSRIDTGVGFNWQYKKNLQMYFEYECSWARDYTKPYGLTLGIRRSW